MLDGCRRLGVLLLSVAVRPLTAADWASVERIFAAGIDGGGATFETSTPDWVGFDAGKIREPRLVAVDEAGAVVGWAAASPVSARAAYRGVIEHSVYVAPEHHGRGIGGMLLQRFVADADAAGFWMIQSSIFPENVASLRLHERSGFRVVGRRERIAILVERRSPHNGID